MKHTHLTYPVWLYKYIRFATLFVFCIALNRTELAAWAQRGGFELPSKTLGIGVIKLQPQQILQAFQDPYFRKAVQSYEFGSRDGMIQPKFFDDNFGLCYFVCTERTDRYYKILVNPLDELYIKTDNDLEFLDWGNFLKNDNFTYISRKDWYNNRIRLQPSDNAPEISYERLYDTMMPLKTQGEWVKVKFFNKRGRQTGWIRWRSETKLLINFQLQD